MNELRPGLNIARKKLFFHLEDPGVGCVLVSPPPHTGQQAHLEVAELKKGVRRKICKSEARDSTDPLLSKTFSLQNEGETHSKLTCASAHMSS